MLSGAGHSAFGCWGKGTHRVVSFTVDLRELNSRSSVLFIRLEHEQHLEGDADIDSALALLEINEIVCVYVCL